MTTSGGGNCFDFGFRISDCPEERNGQSRSMMNKKPAQRERYRGRVKDFNCLDCPIVSSRFFENMREIVRVSGAATGIGYGVWRLADGVFWGVFVRFLDGGGCAICVFWAFFH